MVTLIAFLFLIGYAFIAFEQKIKINKSAISILLAAGCWFLTLIHHWHHDQNIMYQLNNHISDIAQILFFLIGAMSIVEIIDTYHGFDFLGKVIHFKSIRMIIWSVCIMSFILSAFLDNVTTAIIMTTFMQKVVYHKRNRLICACLIIITANAGGAWTPIGDVTTTMLWIKGYISSGPLMTSVFLPSLISVLLPLIYFTFKVRKEPPISAAIATNINISDSKKVFFMGCLALVLVPVLKALFDLPPYLSVLLGLGILWTYTDLAHNADDQMRVPRIISKIDFSSILFLLGILLSVAALESEGIFLRAAQLLNRLVPDQVMAISLIGGVSSVLDNVPLTAATMGMYDLATFPENSQIWRMIAYCVGTGGSLLVFGSAAGIVVMGIEKTLLSSHSLDM